MSRCDEHGRWAGFLGNVGGELLCGGYIVGVWDFQTGGAIAANPIAFAVNGQQRVAIAADRVLYVFGL